MSEASPPVARPMSKEVEKRRDVEDAENEERAIATGGMRRVFKSRQKGKERSRLAVVVRRGKSRGRLSDDEDTGDEEDEDDEEEFETIVQKTSNHYTLNVPAPAPSKSDTPYVLLG